ncbi:MAG: thiaminase II, partial [Gammaproteobacteria bacterium]|nr:thiaminase II [Gammaproteobacteria bacterium]
MTNYGSQVFESLRSQANQTWYAYVEHEFVKQFSDGSLPRQAFLHYLKQDYICLIHFARAWALAVYKSDRIDEMRSDFY